ncbi:mammalian cell entry protein [Mycobacterium bourgelatii]|nr:mammalian cell entry protein [Mycobacterium bourgelatii]MCV6976627.1 mammalian cell entry protein [Mycobacterium bourgelatii]
MAEAEAAAAEAVTDEAGSAQVDETDTAEAADDDKAEAGEAETDTAETETDTAEADTDSAEATDTDSDSTTDSAEADATEKPKKKVRRKRLGGKRLAVAATIVMSLLFIGSAAFAGASVQPYLADKATVAVKLKVARTAANAITTLWTYTPENMDSLADRAATYLSGDFGAQYRKFVDSIAAPNKQAKVTNSTEVTGVAVESLDRDNAVAIVYTNTTTTSPLTKNIPSLKYLSYRLIMRRDDDRWLVTRMTTITSLDLTPRL